MQSYRKNKMIMSELLDYCFSNGMTEASINFKVGDTQNEVTIKGKMKGIPADIQEVIRRLNAPNQPEIEEYYDDLLGLREGRFNVNILAALIDQVDYQYENGEFEIWAVNRTN